mgnify:CR=1 FL=1
MPTRRDHRLPLATLVVVGAVVVAVAIGLSAAAYRRQSLIRYALDPTVQPNRKALTADELQLILPDLIEIHQTNFNYCRSHPEELPIKQFNLRIGAWNAVLAARAAQSEQATKYIAKHLTTEPYGDEVENANSFTP